MKIDSSHFETLEDLLDTIKYWYDIDEIDYDRWFGLEEMKILVDEIERLNNIINELEKYINEEYVYDDNGMKIFDVSKLQDKLQELKGSDKE